MRPSCASQSLDPHDQVVGGISLNDPDLLRTDAFLGGHWAPANSGKVFDVTDPADGKLLAQVAACGIAETEAAIQQAKAALPAWRALPAKARSQVLYDWFDLVKEHSEDLAMILTLEAGKPLAESRGEVAYAASFFQWYAEEAKRCYGETIPSPAADRRHIVIKQPVGVCAMITPWNFPAAMITRKVGPCLAAGSVAVVKPAEDTPLTALALAELGRRAGVPEGVLSVVPGPRASAAEVGELMCTHPDVRKVSFTGSTNVGIQLARWCAGGVKRMSLELGGNAPFIVFDDADLDTAINAAMASKFRNAGQTCVCANRILVQAGIHDAFVQALSAKVAAITQVPPPPSLACIAITFY